MKGDGRACGTGDTALVEATYEPRVWVRDGPFAQGAASLWHAALELDRLDAVDGRLKRIKLLHDGDEGVALLGVSTPNCQQPDDPQESLSHGFLLLPRPRL